MWLCARTIFNPPFFEIAQIFLVCCFWIKIVTSLEIYQLIGRSSASPPWADPPRRRLNEQGVPSRGWRFRRKFQGNRLEIRTESAARRAGRHVCLRSGRLPGRGVFLGSGPLRRIARYHRRSSDGLAGPGRRAIGDHDELRRAQHAAAGQPGQQQPRRLPLVNALEGTGRAAAVSSVLPVQCGQPAGRPLAGRPRPVADDGPDRLEGRGQPRRELLHRRLLADRHAVCPALGLDRPALRDQLCRRWLERDGQPPLRHDAGGQFAHQRALFRLPQPRPDRDQAVRQMVVRCRRLRLDRPADEPAGLPACRTGRHGSPRRLRVRYVHGPVLRHPRHRTAQPRRRRDTRLAALPRAALAAGEGRSGSEPRPRSAQQRRGAGGAGE